MTKLRMFDVERGPWISLSRTEVGPRTVSTIRRDVPLMDAHFGVHCETAVTAGGAWQVVEEYDDEELARAGHDRWVGMVRDGAVAFEGEASERFRV